MREHGDKLDMDVLNSMDTLHLNIQVRCGVVAGCVEPSHSLVAG